MSIQLSDHFSYQRLLRFVFPSVVMMIFTSVYGVVDGLFVSNYVGKAAFAAVNLIIPVLMALGSLGFMIGTGGSAIVSKALGEQDRPRANQYFSMLIYVTLAAGVLCAAAGLALLRPITLSLGAEADMVEGCVLYGQIILAVLPAFMLQNVFQSFFVTAEKPGLGLTITVAAGLTNMVLDFLFIAVFRWGVAGAALATAASQVVGGVLPLFYFGRENPSLLRITRAGIQWAVLGKTCSNGSSELMSNLSMSLVSILFNFQLIHIAGQNGVAAYGVIMYVDFVFVSVFLGYSIGSAPVIGYHYGARDYGELRNLLKKSLVIVTAAGVGMVLLGQLCAGGLSRLFVGYDAALREMTRRGFRLFAVSFLFKGWNIFASAFFTALNNGAASAAISFLRTLLFQVAAVLLLPLVLKLDGIWLAVPLAETLALAVAAVLLIRLKGRYHYL